MSGAQIMFTVFFGLLIINIPIAWSIGLASAAYIAVSHKLSLDFICTTMFTACDSFPLMAIPLFILAGDLMQNGGLSRRLVNFADSLVGHLDGGLAIVTVLTCMFFGAISGSSAATVAAIGGIMVPTMIERGYSKGFSYGLIAASGILGVLIPPSIPMVTYGVATQASISTMFVAGFGPGILCGASLIAVALYTCKKRGYKGNGKRFSIHTVLEAFKDAVWAILVPVIILGGIYGGIFTPTEAAAVAVFYGLFVGFFVYKELTFKKLVAGLSGSAVTTGTILVIVAAATVLARVMTMERIPQAISDAITGATDQKIVVLIIINVVLLITGCVMDSTPAILILSPILYPIAAKYGVDIIHFGLIVVLNTSIGFITPPVGLNLFVACSIGKINFTTVVRNVLPYLAAMVIALIIVTYIPAVALFLPRLFGYGG